MGANHSAHAEAVARENEHLEALRRHNERIQREAKETRERIAREDAERKREAKRREDELREAEWARQAEEARLGQAREEARREAEAAEERAREAERKWEDGIRPVVEPTPEERELAMRTHQYTAGITHVAITGIAGAGKSSLVNAFRGLRNNHPQAAQVGIVETTMVATRYREAQSQLAWYDIPGAGTLATRDWEYFNAQGLYVFDRVIVLFDNRFTETDVAILRNSRRFGIPSYIVRSKSNQHIENIMTDSGYDSDNEDDDNQASLLATARDRFITETNESVEQNLMQAELPSQRVYIVCKETLLAVVEGRTPRDVVIHEHELLRDIGVRHGEGGEVVKKQYVPT
jgi:hypothetical protein